MHVVLLTIVLSKPDLAGYIVVAFTVVCLIVLNKLFSLTS